MNIPRRLPQDRIICSSHHRYFRYNPTMPTNGGGIAIEGANLDRSLNGNECGSTNDQDCPPGLTEGIGPGLVIDANLIVGNSLLTAAGFPMCGESDLKTCVAMLIMDRLEIGGSFAEFHPVDFAEGFVLVGHDGPHHINLADGKPALRSLLLNFGDSYFEALQTVLDGWLAQNRRLQAKQPQGGKS